MNDEPCGVEYGGTCGWIAGHVGNHGPGLRRPEHKHEPNETCDECQSTVGAGRAVQDDGLDTEVLAASIFNVTTSRGHADHPSEECETCRWFRHLATEVADDAAAEYARLRAAPPLPDPEANDDGG